MGWWLASERAVAGGGRHQAVRSAVLDGQFPAADDGGGDDDRARTRCGSMRSFYRTDDLAGLIWEAEDRHDHPLLRYETARDFRGVPAAVPLAVGGRAARSMRSTGRR